MGPDILSESSAGKLKGILHSILRKDACIGCMTVTTAADIITKGSQQSSVSRPAACADPDDVTATHIACFQENNLNKATSDVGTASLPTEATATANSLPDCSNARDSVLPDPGMPFQAVDEDTTATSAEATEAEIAASTASLPVGQRSSNGSINEPGASVWLHEAAIGSVPCSPVSSPIPSQQNKASVDMGLGTYCQSIEDMYSVIFGDCQNDALGTTASGSRRASIASAASSSILHFEQFEPHMYRPDDIHQTSLISQQSCNRGQRATNQPSAAIGSTPVVGNHDDLIVPAGLARIRTGRRCSESEGTGAGLCAQRQLSSGSAADEGVSDQVSWQHADVQAAWTGSGSLSRYSSSCNTSEEGQSRTYNQQQNSNNTHQHKKRLWDRRRETGLSNETSSGYSSSAPASPNAGGGATGSTFVLGNSCCTSTSPRVSSPSGYAHKPLERHGSCLPAPYGDTAYSKQSCSASSLSHSYSFPGITPGGNSGFPPACARALFGGTSQIDRPLMSVGSGSWLIRADSCLDDHLSVASDDGYIREVNAENVLSSVWGPTNRASKLVSFKYSVATSPLNHPGRASPFMSSPFQSPRGSGRENLADLLPLRSASSVVVQSCPGSPLARPSSRSSSMDDAALAARQGHKYLLRQCMNDTAGVYRPSPLQQNLLTHHEGACSAAQHVAAARQCSDSSCGIGTVEKHGSVSSSLTVAGDASAYGHGGVGKVAVAGQQLAYDSAHGTSRQFSGSLGTSGGTGSGEAARCSGRSPAAAVDALMLRWTDAQPAAYTSSSSPSVFAQSCVQLEGGISGGSIDGKYQVAGVRLGLCSVGSISYGDKGSPQTSKQEDRFLTNISPSGDVLPANTAGNSAEPCKAEWSLSVCRSKSMPTPGLLRSGVGSVLGVGNLVPGCLKAASFSPGSSPPPRPRLQTAMSADHSQQQAKLLNESAGHVHRECRRTSSRLSNTNIPNPSRLSQSSAADEGPETLHSVMAAGRSTSGSNHGSSPFYGLRGNVGGDPCSAKASRVSFQTDLQSTGVEEAVPTVSRTSSDAWTVPDGQQHGACTSSCGALEGVVCQGVATLTSDSSSSPAADQAESGMDSAPGQQSISASVAESALLPSLPEVDFIERIGRGSFGEVYKGVWCSSVVAVKVIRVKQPRISLNRGPAATSIGPFNTCHLGTASSTDGTVSLSCNSSSSAASFSAGQFSHGQQVSGLEPDAQEQKIALELAQHEYESWINANLRHPNIVQLFTSFTVVLEDHSTAVLPTFQGSFFGVVSGMGVSWNTHLVMEYCELGTMQGVLQRGLFMDASSPSRCNALAVLMTAKEFCAAVAYLHSMDVVHGDLKSSNVLLKAAAITPLDGRGFVAKVSDFGLSRVMDAISAANGAAAATTIDDAGAASDGGSGAPIGQGSMQHHFGALSHAAPELIKGEELSKASDVYSLGVLLWELVTGRAPFCGIHPGQLINIKLCQPTSELLPFPDTAPAALAALALDCWAQCPAQRPTMPAVVDRLNCFALELLGEEQAVMLFPDIARMLNAHRSSAP